MRFDESIDADSTLALFAQLERANPLATRIYVICDNARYYCSQAVQEYLKSSRIKLVFRPPYAPNLNLIERLWKFFKKQVMYNRCEPWRAKRRRVVPSSPSAECVPVDRCGSSGRREYTKASRQGVKSLWNDVPTPCWVGTRDAGQLGPPEAMIAA